MKVKRNKKKLKISNLTPALKYVDDLGRMWFRVKRKNKDKE